MGFLVLLVAVAAFVLFVAVAGFVRVWIVDVVGNVLSAIDAA